MKNAQSYHLPLWLFAAASSLFFACQRSLHEPSFTEIVPVVATSRDDAQGMQSPLFTDYFELKGFCALKGVDRRIAFDIRKMIRHDHTIVAYSNRGDFQDVCLFDAATGQLMRQIGRNSENGDGYKCLRDIDVRNDEIVMLNSGDMSFMHYRFDGKLRRTLTNGVFGDNVYWASDGSYWVYNEHNESEVSGTFYLLRFDRDGHLTDRLLPYASDGYLHILDYTGEMLKVGDRLWVNPPLSDTLFELNTKTRSLVPTYVLNPPHPMSANDKKRAQKGAIPDNLRYMDHHFAPLLDGLLYVWVEGTDMHTMYCDRQSGANISLRAGADLGGLNALVANVFNIHPVDSERFMLRVPHGSLSKLMTTEDWARSFEDYPELADEISYGANNKTPLVLTFAVKKR